MKNLRDHVKAIISGLNNGGLEQYGEHPEYQDDIDVIAEILEDPNYGEDVMMAYLKFWEESGASVEVWEIPSNLSDHYRGHYDSPGKFARQEAEEYASVNPGKKEFLSEYGNWIDWEGKAASADFGDFTFIKLPEYHGVYVFWN